MKNDVPTTAKETTTLLSSTSPPEEQPARHGFPALLMMIALLFGLFSFLVAGCRKQQQHSITLSSPFEDANLFFPSNFTWGVATSAYQIEGATHEDGRGMTIWDTFAAVPGNILDNSTGDIADDHYHLWKEDIALMERLQIKAYRFSIAWSRIVPLGKGPVNEEGLAFYHTLIDELLLHNIEPWITLFHWDLPQALQDDHDGFLGEETVDAFVDYARIVFEEFGSKVKRFITLNEPWTYAVNGHSSGIHAPGRNQNPAIEPYLVAHNLLLAHAKVVALYKKEYSVGGGMIGIANCGDYRYPLNSDDDAAERSMLFQWGWFVEPLVFGDYPASMRERLGDRLPSFTTEQSRHLQGSFDFLGLNFYSAFFASTPKREATYGGYWADIHVDFSDDPHWKQNDMGWNIVPHGLREMLLWIQRRYNDPLLFITENGSAVYEPDVVSATHDVERQSFLARHLKAANQAMEQGGVRLGGYFAWSLLDNFEWQFGYQRRFGMVRVDFDTLARIPKGSALLYQRIIKHNKEQHASSNVNASGQSR